MWKEHETISSHGLKSKKNPELLPSPSTASPSTILQLPVAETSSITPVHKACEVYTAQLIILNKVRF